MFLAGSAEDQIRALPSAGPQKIEGLGKLSLRNRNGSCASGQPVRRSERSNQKPDSIRWKTISVKVEICAPTKGAETATVTRMATIFGTKVRVIS